MWPFDSRRERQVLRVGRVALEHFVETGGRLVLRGAVPWSGTGQPGAAELAAGLATLVAGGGLRGAVTVVLESAWAPVMLIEVGERLLGERAVEALAQHHLRVLFADGAATARWELRLEHRAGEPQALVFALPASAREQWQAMARQHGLKLAGLVPAWDWGRQRLLRQVPREGWWAWVEQDRQLLAWMQAGRVRGLHPALKVCETGAEVGRQVRCEAARLGQAGGVAEIAVGHWGERCEVETLAGGGNVRWCGMGADTASPGQVGGRVTGGVPA